MFKAVLADRKLWQAICAGEQPLGPVIEESLRFDSPVQAWRRQAKQDVVLDGHAGDKCYRLCVWGRARPEVDTLSVRACADRAGGEGSISVLMYVPPGKRHTNFSDDFVFIFTDAYDDYGWEKAGSTWYWKDGRWNEFFSSD